MLLYKAWHEKKLLRARLLEFTGFHTKISKNGPFDPLLLQNQKPTQDS
jgi:hypothetical protein